MNNLMTMEQMDTNSVPKVTKVSNVISALDPISKSLNTFPGSCETIEGTTSFASNNLRRKSLKENTHLGAPDSGVEADNSNDNHFTNSKVSGGCKNSEDNVLPCESINANTTADNMNDVKVCDICGDVGYEDMLVICSECNAGAEHIYCMQTLLYAVPEGDWFCDDCKLKNKGRDQRKSIIDSPTLSSFSQDAEKQVGNENSALKVSSSGKFKLSSDKMQLQKSAHNSVVHCKRQRGDSNDAPENRKQVIECDNVPVNASQPLLQRNSSCKVQETIRADSCRDLPQIKISVSPPYTSDGSSKMSGAGKFDSYAMKPLANKNSKPRSFSRENSFKNAETAKVKFLPTHTVASLCSGMASRESSKFTGVDGNTDAASPQTGIIDSLQISSRGRSIPMIDSAGPLVNRSAHQSYFRSASAYSCLQSAGLSKSEDAFPSFLLSSRLHAPRGHSNLRSSKEAINGNWQLDLAGNSSGTMGTTRGDGSRSCVPVSSNYSKDYKIIAPGNDEVNGILKHSSGTFAFSSSQVKKSNVDISAQNVLISGSSKSDELTLAKANSHLRSPSAKKCSAVLTEVLQPQKLMCEDLKGHAMAKLGPKGLILTNKAVEGLACTEHPNVLDSDKESPGGMKPMKGIINMSELSHKKNGNQLPASVLVEDDRVLTSSVVSTRMELVMEDKAVLDVLKDRLPKVDGSLLIEESEVSMLIKEDCKCPDFGEDPKLSISNKKVATGSLVKKTNEMGTPETSNMSLDKDRVNDCSSTLHDNTSAFRLKSTPVSLVNDSNLVEASKTSSALLWTKQNIFSEMVLGRNDGKMEIKPTSNVIVKGSSDLSTYTINEANAKPINGFCKDPFSLGGSLEKDVIPSSIPHKFGRNVSMATQSDKSMIQPSEINLSASVLVQTPVHSPSSKKYVMGVPLQDMFDFTPTKLPTWPESLFLWRGGFEIIDKISGHQVFDGMQAHPSNKASPKVYEVSRKFPSQLLLEQVQRYDAWPKRFQECPPTDEDIALYILPVETESYKIQYFELLEATIKQDLALRVYLECAELLIYSSNQLPESYHRCNGRMYLWGVFRGGKKIHMADARRQFPDCNNVGSNVVQPSSSFLLMKNQNSLPRHLTSITTSGCSEGEEDMDVDMEGGREIGMKETPAPRAKSCPANVIESNTMKKSVLSNSKPLLSHHENFKSGSCMPFERDNLSLVTSWSGSAKIFGKIPEGEEAIDVDIEVGREIGMAERPKESQLANVIKSNATQTFFLSNSKPIISHHYNSQSGRHIPFEQGHFSSIASRSASAKILGKIPEYMLSTSYVEDGERRNEQSSTYDAINELDFPPGFELPPVFRHSSSISRNNPGKHIEAMFENMNSFGIHSKLQGWELSPSLGLPNDIMESSDKDFAPGFFSQGCNCPPSTVLESEEFPPGFNPASLKPSVSSPGCPPGLELSFMKSLVSSPNCPCVLEPAFMKSLMSSPVCPPGLGPTYIKPLVSSAECPPGLVATSVTSPDCPPGLELTSMKPLVSSPDCPPGLEPASMKPLLCSPDCLPGLETTSMTPLVSSTGCSPGLEAASVKPSGTSPDCPPSLEPAVGNPLFSLHFSHGTDPANGMLNLSSSEGPLGFESTSGKYLFHSSDDPLENLACKHLQDKPDLEVQNKLEPFCQCSVHLSSGKVDSSRNHTEIYYANGSSGATHSHSLTSVTREADKDSNAAKMSKKKSFTEEFYYNRSSKREKDDKRERSRSRSREKECNWRRSGSSNREKEGRERWRNYSREKEGRRKRYINYSRDKEAKKQMDRKHSGEEQDAKNRARKNTERENGRDRDRGYHRHRSRYVGTRRHKDHEKHSHNSFGCSYPESTTVSYSSLGGKCRIDATWKMISSHHANSSYADSNSEHHSSKRPSLGIYSENGEKAVTVSLLKGKVIMDNDSAQVPHSEHCSLESEEKLLNTDVGRLLTDNDHILLCDLNDENLDEKNLSGTASQEATQVNISDTVISRTKYSVLHSGQVEQYVIPVESNLSSGSMLTMHDSVQCLQLFPIKGNCGAADTSVSDWDLSLELGLGQRTASKEPLPLLEQSSSQSLCCNFMLNNGSRTSRSRSVCDDSWEANPVEASILSLSMPRYRKQGNSWVEVAKDSELSEEVDANLKLTLSMVQKD